MPLDAFPRVTVSRGFFMADQLSARVSAVLARVLDLPDAAAIRPDDELTAPPLEVDSLRLLEVLVRIEQEFSLRVEDGDVYAAKLRTVADLVRLVRTALAVETG